MPRGTGGGEIIEGHGREGMCHLLCMFLTDPPVPGQDRATVTVSLISERRGCSSLMPVLMHRAEGRPLVPHCLLCPELGKELARRKTAQKVAELSCLRSLAGSAQASC